MVSGLVSVIIPCYNQEKYISDALDSLLGQTYTNWECILVDDGSIDRSAEIVQEYCIKDTRFRLVKQSNQGVAAARNSGFKLAQGEFIQFLDGDDFIDSKKLEVQTEILSRFPEIDISYTNHLHYFQDKNLYESYKVDPITDPLENFLFQWDQRINIPLHAPLFRRNVWERNDYPYPPDYNDRYEDWVFWILIGLKNKKFHFVDENLAYYRVHSGGFTSSVYDNTTNAIKAAFYLVNKLPVNLSNRFINETLQFRLEKYYQVRVREEVHSRLAWKIGKRISPFLYRFLPDWIKVKYKIKKV